MKWRILYRDSNGKLSYIFDIAGDLLEIEELLDLREFKIVKKGDK